MELFKKLETMIENWLKPIPNLPKNAQKWLSENVWWLALVSVILSVISILFAFGALATYASVTSSVALYGLNAVIYDQTWLVRSVITLLFTIVIVILTAAAIKPLQLMSKRGWRALFFVFVVSAAETVANALLTLSIVGFIVNIIFGAIGLTIAVYFLFQIRGYFGSAIKAKHVAKPVTK
jgi:hypothetical protein